MQILRKDSQRVLCDGQLPQRLRSLLFTFVRRQSARRLWALLKESSRRLKIRFRTLIESKKGLGVRFLIRSTGGIWLGINENKIMPFVLASISNTFCRDLLISVYLSKSEILEFNFFQKNVKSSIVSWRIKHIRRYAVS